MRTLTDHMVNPANRKIVVEATDEPGTGGANYRYEVSGFDTTGNPANADARGYMSSFSRLLLLFQNGPVNQTGDGVNGITNEVLLAIVADRLRSFQSGPYACRENALALTKLEEAQHWLQHRTQARTQRGVEGTHTV